MSYNKDHLSEEEIEVTQNCGTEPPFSGKLLYEKRDGIYKCCLLYTSPSPRDRQKSRMPSSA